MKTRTLAAHFDAPKVRLLRSESSIFKSAPFPNEKRTASGREVASSGAERVALLKNWVPGGRGGSVLGASQIRISGAQIRAVETGMDLLLRTGKGCIGGSTGR